MYDFYPEWGPARHRDDHDRPAVRRPRYWQPDSGERRVAAMAPGPEGRDAGVQRPDDN